MSNTKPSQLHLCPNSSGDHLMVQSLTQYINRRMRQRDPINVQQLCTLTGYSQPTLYRKVIDAIGIPPKQLITKLRCEQARKLLLTTDISVVEVAYQCGFSSGNYFAKVFKHYFCCSPTEFRNKK